MSGELKAGDRLRVTAHIGVPGYLPTPDRDEDEIAGPVGMRRAASRW